jgi:7-cyano-7-deazaguanine synthase in queuosine biosynthesis
MRIVVLNSGGKDSLAAMMVLKEQGHELFSLFVDLGVPNSDAAAAIAGKLAENYCLSHDTMSVRSIIRVRHETQKMTSVPHQTLLVNVLGGIWAYPRGIDVIASGERRSPVQRSISGNDHMKFEEMMGSIFTVGLYCKPPTVIAPVKEWTNDQIFEKVKSEPLWSQTVTCNEWPPCGTCGRCILRARWVEKVVQLQGDSSSSLRTQPLE